MNKYDILLFDADDTLFDFGAAERNALTGVLNDFSISFDDSVYELYHSINEELWTEYGKKLSLHDMPLHLRFEKLLKTLELDGDSNSMNRAYFKHLAQQSILFPDSENVCKALSKTHKMYIITNGTTDVQHSRFDASPIRGFFDDMFISWEIGFGKPDKNFFDIVISRIPQVPLSSMLIIGDSLTSDIAGGIAYGIDTCWYNPHGKTAPDNLKPTYEIRTLPELLDIV